jgi:hypothetical protein
MSEFSHLSEQIPEQFAQTESYTVIIVDGNGNNKRGQIHLPVNFGDPYSLDLSQFIPNPPVKLEDLVSLISSTIEDAQVREGTIPSERIKVVKEYQPEHFPEIGDEVITFTVNERKPWRTSRDGNSRPNRGFSYSYEYTNPKEPNKVLQIEERTLDHTIELTVWGKTSTLADRRALWLERLMVSNTWIFRSKGINPFYFDQRNRDTLWIHQGARLHQRPMRFFARLREYNIIAFPTMREFEINFDLSTK